MRLAPFFSCFALLLIGVGEAAAEDFQTGLLPENPESYKTFPIRQTYRNFLPASKDLSDFFPPVGRQGAQSSCVGWALGYAARSYYARRQTESEGVLPEPFSPSFIYNQTKEGGCNSGSSISSGLKLLETIGVIGISEFPYEPQDCSRQPTPAQLAMAMNHRIKSWARVDTDQIDALKAEIYQGNPVVVGVWVTPSFYQIKKDVYSDISEDNSGGHALVVVGYDDQRRAFKVFNSWGENWGERGLGWISYDAMTKRIQNAFVMELDMAQKGGQAIQTPRVELQHSSGPPRQLSQELIDGLINSFPCLSIQPGRENQGHPAHFIVGDATTAAQLLAWLRKATGVEPANMKVDVRPWPQCEAIQTLSPLMGSPNDLSILINGQPEVALRDGDSLLLTIEQTQIKKYLGVFYLQADGSVVSLTVPDLSGSEVLQKPMVLGQSPHNLSVGKPLGEEMVIAIASNSPLPDGLRSDASQPDRAFLSRLRSEIMDAKPFQKGVSPFSVAYAILHTH